MTEALHLYEEILLLALRDEEGTVVPGAMLRFALGGALLAELLLDGRVRLAGKRRHLIELIEEAAEGGCGDQLLDECLGRVRVAKRRASLQVWTNRLAGLPELKHRAARRLVERGILRADEEKVLLIFRRRVYPEIDPAPERALIERLRAIVLDGGACADPRSVVLISLARATGLLKTFLAKGEQRARKARIEAVINGEAVGAAAREAIEAMQAAIIATCVIPAVVASACAS